MFLKSKNQGEREGKERRSTRNACTGAEGGIIAVCLFWKICRYPPLRDF